MDQTKEPLLVVKGLKKHFPFKKGMFSKETGYVRAVDGVDFTVYRGETLGIVGESGCGKSTTGQMILQLLEPTEGEIWFEGRNLSTLGKNEVRTLRQHLQMIFQDPYSSLNPRMRVEDIVAEPLRVHGTHKGSELKEKVVELLRLVGLDAHHMSRHPHEFSGGQRQRIGIARALALNPSLIVCDEPVSALDVSIQAQVLNLMQDLQSQFSLTYMFISHDLSVVKFICDRVGVMYLGRMVEMAPTAEMFAEPLHPYTKALMSAVPVPDPEAARERIVLTGDVPNPQSPPTGCTFHTRCPYVMDSCRQAVPEWREVSPGRHVACHLFEQ